MNCLCNRYHHISVLLYCWLSMKYEAPGYFYGIMNAFVHSVMWVCILLCVANRVLYVPYAAPCIESIAPIFFPSTHIGKVLHTYTGTLPFTDTTFTLHPIWHAPVLAYYHHAACFVSTACFQIWNRIVGTTTIAGVQWVFTSLLRSSSQLSSWSRWCKLIKCIALNLRSDHV